MKSAASTAMPDNQPSTARRRHAGAGWFEHLQHDECGVAAIEFALLGGVLVVFLLNGIDVARYLYVRTQVENAAQAGAHAVWKTCDPRSLPVISKCSAWEAAATSAIYRTLLDKDTDSEDDGVTLKKPPVEGYFCPSDDGALVPVTDFKNLPEPCVDGATPGTYIQLSVTYTYAPIFGDLSVTHLLGTSISKTSYMRLQ